ncbi:A-kinase anchor protein 6 isoform X3 [Dunckerocampus dactyliophorus]|uniref:A-kinase anchor protein 6 isoform X3 n=1 Tax=Dunckerocampus dactyliophorus TaxID=161453 RepID=UPI0024069178|nr:A-kinase anchor protein 6 isoform X3 [Dunckerocampus dactyliophorus]
MSVLTLSPVAPEPPSPMVTSITPTLDTDTPTAIPTVVNQEGGSSLGPLPDRVTGGRGERDSAQGSKKPPPLHTGADWKVVLHLPEIEKWLRATADRVTQLSHSVGQDGANRHVDAHLVQLKDICEDISDHVEQIHALLETEFSLKLLSYSVNIIVDIRTVQLLWHQLRVSVLVLKERLLQGLQDPNGNFTRQTDILQAFSQDQHQTRRLDALTEVDDCGQLTIRCSQDYFSLDCGITAFELSDYSPGEEPEARDTSLNQVQDVDQKPDVEQIEEPEIPKHELQNGLAKLVTCDNSSSHTPPPSVETNQSETAKRSLPGQNHNSVPLLPKRGALVADQVVDTTGGLSSVSPVSELQNQRTTALMDPPDRSKFWLELDSVCPEDISESFENLQQVMNVHSIQRHHMRPLMDRRGSFRGDVAPPPQEGVSLIGRTRAETCGHSEGDSDSSLPSPMREQVLSSDLEASGEELDPRPPGKMAVWMVKPKGHKEVHVSSETSPDREHWYGSEEFLALPAQLHKSDMLAINLESLARTLRPVDEEVTCDGLQDVDDWDLTELNPDWDSPESGDDVPSPLLRPNRQNPLGRFSPASSSDIVPSLDDSIESGPLSELQSEEEDGRGSADHRLQPVTTPLDRRGGASLVRQLLEDIRQDKNPDVWKTIENLVQQLDSFISWLQEALESTENWTQPRADLDSLRVYLDTHLTFKLNVESHSALKENIMEDGRALLATIPAHQSGLREILHMVSSQWEQLQLQIRRQHSWMLHALRCIQTRLLNSKQSQEPLGELTANQQALFPADHLQAELVSSHHDVQKVALEQMAAKLSSLHYTMPSSRRHYGQLVHSSSVQDFEAEYQELWDWLMDMDAMVTDSHQLMMSEEQREHLFKSSHAELMAMENRKTSLLGRAESLKRSGTELPSNFHHQIHNLTHTWTQLENILSGHSGSTQLIHCSPAKVHPLPAAAENPLSPLSTAMLEQLQARIKELKAWLRHTELLIFNSCLRRDSEASTQLASFKSLCSDVRARRRGVSSVLKLCQKLLQQNQSGPAAEAGPEAEQHREALQLLSINLERRWEAIVMQTLQWQNRLKKELGQQQVPGNFLEPGLVDIHQPSPVRAPPVAPAPDDSWEWDETDMTITESQEVPEPDLTHNLPTSDGILTSQNPEITSQIFPPDNKATYQVYSLHTVEFYSPHAFSKVEKRKQHMFQKSLSKDSTFSSMESLPDLLGGLMPGERGGERPLGCQREGGRASGQSSISSRPSESESGIVSDGGDIETVTTNCGLLGDEEEEDVTVTLHKDDQRGGTTQRTEDERQFSHKTGGSEAVDILINGAPPDSGRHAAKPLLSCSGLDTPPALQNLTSSPVLSQGSSLESLLALGLELFPSKEILHRSASLESGLAPCHSVDGDTCASLASLVELDLGQMREGDHDDDHGGLEDQRIGEGAQGELSRRTLDLLKRLENIQSPLVAKMTRSVSDMTLRSSSPVRRQLVASPSLGGRHAALSRSSRKAPPSLINESSASLTELSSTEDSSLASEDLTVLPNQRNLLPDQASNKHNFYRRCCKRSSQREEADALSLSMVVNVSCTSTCTDDEDDSDLLSSSTLTLTEEELGVRDGEEEEEEERLTPASSGNEEDEDEDTMDHSYMEYMKKELQGWSRPTRTSSLSKTEEGLQDELQCGSNLTSSEQHQLLNCRHQKEEEEREQQEAQENLRNAPRSFSSHFVDDLENGNIEPSCFSGKDQDDLLLREESSVFTKKGEPLRETYTFSNVFIPTDSTNQLPSSPSCELLTPTSSLVGQLKGELPCQSSSSSPLLPRLDRQSHNRQSDDRPGVRKAITIQEKFKFSSLVMEKSRSEVRDKDSCLPTKKWKSSNTSCCQHLTSHSPSSPSSPQPGRKEAVHDFVMEILEMARRGNDIPEELKQTDRKSDLHRRPASLAQIRDKVLQHSHQPLQLRKGDFYSYLALSSHDSDCGEVTQCTEDKSATPAPYVIPAYATPTQGLSSPEPDTNPSQGTSQMSSTCCDDNKVCALDLESHDHLATSPSPSFPQSPDIRDEETLFPACTEEVYLGPPLCYSMPPTKKAPKASLLTRHRGSDPEEVIPPVPEPLYSSFSISTSPMKSPAETSCSGSGEDPRLLCDVAGGVGAWRGETSLNEAPSYLHPLIDSPSAARTKALESNIGVVMTKISVGGAATNPSKEPAAAAARINPKMNCWPMKEADRAAGGRRGEADARSFKQPEATARGRRGSRQEAKMTTTTAAKQVSSVNQTTRASQGRSQIPIRPPASRMGPIRGGPAGGGAIRVQP